MKNFPLNKVRQIANPLGLLLNEDQKRVNCASEYLNKPDSCLFYTTHKCASSFAVKILKLFQTKNGLKVRNYHTAILSMGDRIDCNAPCKNFIEESYSCLFKRRGEIYGPLRTNIDFPGRENFKHVFFLRDPRDVLISGYYSFGFTHRKPLGKGRKDNFRRLREEVLSMSIDEYALSRAESWITPLYDGYKKLLETSSSYLFLKYENFSEDPQRFIESIEDYIGIEAYQKDKEKIAHIAAPIQANEDRSSHKRSGKSRQFKEELKNETVEELNLKLKPVLEYWGFDV